MLTRRAFLALVGVPLVAGCHPAAARTPAAGGSPAAGAASGPRPGQVVAALRQAWLSGDRQAFVALFAPQARSHGALLFDNASLLGSFDLEPVSGTPGAAAERVRLTWRAGGEREAAVVDAEVTTSPDGLVDAMRLAAGVHEPPWWRHPVSVVGPDGGSGDVWLVTTRDRASAAAPWLAAAEVAVGHLQAARLTPWEAGWDGTLVLEVPQDLLAFEAGPDSVAYASLESGAGRIAVNPTQIEGYGPDERVGLLVHEGVHVVTRSPGSAAPLWAIEGLAESVATGVWAAQSAENLHLVLRAGATAAGRALGGGQADDRSGVRVALPTDEQLAEGGLTDRQVAYALAEVAVEGCFARWGRDRVLGWVDDWAAPGRPGTDEITRAYRDELERRRPPAR